MSGDVDRLRDLPLRAFRPRASLRAPDRTPERFATPAVDSHAHLGRWLTGGWAAPDVGALLAAMDEANVAAIVNLDGRWGDELEANLVRYDRAHAGRFVTFAQVDWGLVTELTDPGKRLAAQLRESVGLGARGLKVWKDLGLHVRDSAGMLLMPDDERLDPLWDACEELGLPVTIHSGDPLAFFEPLDERNERLEELLAHPDWHFGDRERFPTSDVVFASLQRLVTRRSKTTFVLAHAGIAEDLGWIERMLASAPNVCVDIGARIPELGRRPRAFADLVRRFPDRVLFATDAVPPDVATWRIHARFLETADESFPYSPEDPPPEGRWPIGGLDLEPEILRLVEGDTARRLISGLRV